MSTPTETPTETSQIDIHVHAGHRWLPRNQWIQAINVNVGKTQWTMIYKDPIDFLQFDKAIRSEQPALPRLPKTKVKSLQRPDDIVAYLQAALKHAPMDTQRFLGALDLGRYVHDENTAALHYYRDEIAGWRDAADGTLLHYAAGSGKLVSLVAAHCTVSLRDRFGLLPCHVAALVGNFRLSHQLNNTGEPVQGNSSEIDVPLQYRKANNARSVLILVNPVSGKGFAMRVFEESVAPILDIACERYEMRETSELGEATEIARRFDISKFDTIMCVSGDGIVHEVIQGLSRRRGDGEARGIQRFPFVIVPAGSGNAVVCSHSGPSCGPVDVMKKFITGCYSPADLIEVRPLGGNPQPETESIFAIVSVAWGLLSDVDFDSEPMRSLGKLRFTLMAVLRLLIRKKYVCNLRFRSSESEEYTQLTGNMDFFVAANVPYLSSDMKIAPTAKIADGKIHICLSQGKSKAAMLSMLACDVEDGSHIKRSGVVNVSCTELIIEPISQNSILDIDGERCYQKGAHCFIRPAAASHIA